MSGLTFRNWRDMHITASDLGEAVMFYAGLGMLVAEYVSGPPARAELELPDASGRLVITRGDVPGAATLIVDDIRAADALLGDALLRCVRPVSRTGAGMEAIYLDPNDNMLTLVEIDYRSATIGKVPA